MNYYSPLLYKKAEIIQVFSLMNVTNDLLRVYIYSLTRLYLRAVYKMNLNDLLANGYLSRTGHIKRETQNVPKKDKRKNRTGRAYKRLLFNRRQLNERDGRFKINSAHCLKFGNLP
jgi:hypothetical protein